jgi:radical SAM superfamily enzyme YgiQ (UPF0313 family)
MRIALVAMNGVRVQDTELLRLGLALPGFQRRLRAIASLPNLGLLILGGMTPPEHQVDYVEMPDLAGADALLAYDLVAVSSCSAQIDEAYTLARRLRTHGTPVVIGGLHATVLPDEALDYASAVAVGEGEVVWEAILRDAARGRLMGMYGDRVGAYDLAQSPLPAFHLLARDRHSRLLVQTSRGCPHDCEFCASSRLLCPRYKQKPIGHVLAEIDHIRGLWPHPFFEFADDNTLLDRAYWRELLPELRRRHVRWFAETDVSIGDDDELLALLREAGCAQVLIGLESPVRGPLRGLELSSDWKYRQWPRYREAVRRIQAHGVRVLGCFVLGLDGQGPEIFDQVYEFAADAALYDAQVTIQTPFPGTPLYARLQRAGRLLAERVWDRCTLFDVNFVPTHMTVEELRVGFRELVRRLYAEEITRQRQRSFQRQFVRLQDRKKGVAA